MSLVMRPVVLPLLCNEALNNMLADGTVDAILKKWHVEKVEDLLKAQQ